MPYFKETSHLTEIDWKISTFKEYSGMENENYSENNLVVGIKTFLLKKNSLHIKNTLNS